MFTLLTNEYIFATYDRFGSKHLVCSCTKQIPITFRTAERKKFFDLVNFYCDILNKFVNTNLFIENNTYIFYWKIDKVRCLAEAVVSVSVDKNVYKQKKTIK